MHEQIFQDELFTNLAVLAKAQTQATGDYDTPSAWLLPNLQVLEVDDSIRMQEWLVSFASARLMSPDVANIRTIFLSYPEEQSRETQVSPTPSLHLDSLRLLVPEVLPGKIPPLFYHQ